jgi:hypothetical protein
VPIVAALKGSNFKYQLKAINSIGSTSSLVGQALFATIPDAPVAGPVSDASVTNKQRIKVTWAVITGAANGASEILSYELSMDDGAGGDFVALTANNGTEYLKLTYTVFERLNIKIVEGVTYRFQYRSRNAVGWSNYSPVSYITAAAKPDRPPAPQLQTATAAGLTLILSPTAEDGGSPITGYKIFRDDGNAFVANTYATELTRYTGAATTFLTTILDDGLVSGKTYRFVYAATNAYGDSEFSNHLVAGVGAPPQLTQAPLRDTTYDVYNPSTGQT